jgi:transcriptional regulator with XRE-family HTH domain
MVHKGTFRRGHTRNAKLSPAEVLEIRELYHQQNWTQGALARRFGMSIVSIGRIVRGESFVHYGGPGYHIGADEPPAEQKLHEAAEDKIALGGAPAPDDAAIAASIAKTIQFIEKPPQGGESAGETPALPGDNDHDH